MTAVPDDDKAYVSGHSRFDDFVLRQPRVGDLTTGWRVFLIVTWVAVFFAFAGVWKASEEIGIGTWWLGSRSQPTPVFIRMIPFAGAFTVALLATYNIRRLPYIGLAAAVGVALLAVFDFRWSTGLAVAELGIAAGALLVALGSLGGRYRAAAPSTAALPPPDPT